MEEDGLSIEDASVMDYEEMYAEIDMQKKRDWRRYNLNVLAQRLFLMVMTGKRH